MTSREIETSLKACDCAVVEDGGRFALAYPFGTQGSKRAHDLRATTRDGALTEAWDFLHPEVGIKNKIAKIQEVVAQDYGVSVSELLSDDRHMPLPIARHLAIALCVSLKLEGCQLIGKAFGRDHSMVSYAAVSVRERCETEPAFAARFGALNAKCLTAIGGTAQ